VVPAPLIQILVCTNDRGMDAPKPSCAQRGGIEVYRRLKDEVRSRGLKESVLVTRTGCMHHCSRGVTVAVWPGNFWYGGVLTDDASALLDAALAGEELVRRRMPPGPWE
jgi:(2Fe-2S) ferredoxin